MQSSVANSRPSTISLHVVGALGIEEAPADAELYPGHLIELTSTGKVRKHATAGGSTERMFAIEASSEDGGTVATAYAANEKVYHRVFQPGERALARLANGESAVIGSKLESNGDGTLRVVDADASAGDIKVNSVVGVALEAIDMSSSDAADAAAGGGLIKIRLV